MCVSDTHAVYVYIGVYVWGMMSVCTQVCVCMGGICLHVCTHAHHLVGRHNYWLYLQCPLSLSPNKRPQLSTILSTTKVNL